MRCSRSGFRSHLWSWLLTCAGILSLTGCPTSSSGRKDSGEKPTFARYEQGVFTGDDYNFNRFQWRRYGWNGRISEDLTLVIEMSAGDLSQDELTSPEKMRELPSVWHCSSHSDPLEITLLDTQTNTQIKAF